MGPERRAPQAVDVSKGFRAGTGSAKGPQDRVLLKINRKETLMNIPQTPELPRVKSANQPFPSENPRMFGANCDDQHECAEVYEEKDFMARWWPGEINAPSYLRKPR